MSLLVQYDVSFCQPLFEKQTTGAAGIRMIGVVLLVSMCSIPSQLNLPVRNCRSSTQSNYRVAERRTSAL